MKKAILIVSTLCIYIPFAFSQKVDYSAIDVREESEWELTKITNDNDHVCLPIVKRSSKNVNWLSNRIVDTSKDGNCIAFVATRNGATNIYVKDLNKQVSSIQRTNRSAVLDFSYSPDGKYIVFSEASGGYNQIFQTDAIKGYVCRQITNSNNDFSPVYSKDMSQIFFARQENNNISIWGYDVSDKILSNFTTGYNPNQFNDSTSILCTRPGSGGRSEIWRVDFVTGTEECIVADSKKSFSTPMLSPDGKWVLMVGTGFATVYDDNDDTNDQNYQRTIRGYYTNTDIYVCRIDGSELTQLTFHAADDLSPVWSYDGKYIYFISQRGSSTGTANIWRMKFLY